jgi:murein DD-endopeptidase MepM/ murein hydrolase activator NlpD
MRFGTWCGLAIRAPKPAAAAHPGRLRLRLAAWAAAAALLAWLPANAAPARGRAAHRPPRRNARELRRQLSTVRRSIHQKRVELRATRRRERKITDDIESVETRLLTSEARLRRAKRRLAFLRSEDARLKERIVETERRLVGRRRVLGRRVRDNYERGKTSYVHVLLRSRSLHDYLSRSYYVERIVESDVKLMAGIKQDQKQLAEDRERLSEQAREQARLREVLEVEAAQYRSDVDLKRDLLHDVRETRETQEEALDLLEQASNEIEAHIRAVQQTPRGRVRLLQTWSGSFIRPASGPVTSQFGMRFHPILHRSRMHTGVDIGAHYGSPIRAAAPGVVILAGYMRGYGNTIIVDHGGGVSTLYGHCSDLVASEGQSVGRGQIIARVGSTGLSTGPHLHFEVRHNGTPVSPL